ncbi:MAG: zinc carboxypeptidase, partial [Planctomycetota bacterium]
DSLPVFRNHAKFIPLSENPYCNAAVYDDSPHIAGYCSDENLSKLKDSGCVVIHPMGKGRLIQISDDPNFRAFWHGTRRLFLNAIFFGKFTNPGQ